MRFASLLALVASMTLATTAGATPPTAPTVHAPPVVRPVIQPARPPEVRPIQVTIAPPAEIHLTTAASLPRAPRPAVKSQAPATPAALAPQLYTGVRALLGSLKERNIAFGVASNNKRAYVVGLVSKLGLGDLLPAEHVVASDWGETYESKPSPKILQVLAAKQGTDPKTTIYFGDKPDDVRAARAAGMIGVGITHGDPAAEKEFRDAGASMVITKINQENLTPVLRFVDQVGAKAVYFDWDDTLATNPHRPATEKADPLLFNKTSLLVVSFDRLAA